MKGIRDELKNIRRIFHSILIEEMLCDLLKTTTVEELAKQLQFKN
jgi:hypothetical protein